ncbi:ComEC/Rec2 family competence protein [Psychroserpens mesophilus]|uniref:ComEC/Rec2 family competence protein n=1 Tax=Psychroserpens mesophilus TaxID=325473 RepID=UPI00058E28CB|nr:MBL fold metallo-hydrolase [Psychroserpens mesophilus]
MVRLIFKDVGQGDSIILEWSEDDTNKIAIIDCNIYSNSNPVLDHIKVNNIIEIEFILLTHPHLDHFSGMFDLLDYCIKNNIKVKRFLHTSLVTPDYLMMATRSKEASRELQKLWLFLNKMIDNNQIERYVLDDNPNMIIPLGEEFKMEVLAPSSIEIDKYISSVKFPFDEEGVFGHPNANWLSTVLRIYNDKISALLTSDSEKNVLTRIGNRKSGRLGLNRIGLGQSPHHGSKRNHNILFWQLRKRTKETPIVFSVGPNSYGHPNSEVLRYFQKLAHYKIERTDLINGITKKTSTIQKKSNNLDLISSIYSTKPERGDLIFKLEKDICEKI